MCSERSGAQQTDIGQPLPELLAKRPQPHGGYTGVRHNGGIDPIGCTELPCTHLRACV
jgi:hypothetical protein